MNRILTQAWKTFGGAIGATASLAVTLAGCTALFPSATTQCATDSDCALDGSRVCVSGLCSRVDSLGELGCGGKLSARAIDETNEVTFSLQVRDPYFGPNVTPRGGRVRVCEGSGPFCSSTVGEPLPFDADGQVTLALPEGFVGFADIDVDGFLPTLVAFADPLTDRDIPVVISPRPENFENRFLPTEIDYDASKGSIIARVSTCSEALSGEEGERVDRSGVRIDSESLGATPIYYSNSIEPEAQLTETSSEGIVGVYNLDEGLARLRSVVADGDELFGDTEIPVRAGAITFFELSPSRKPPESM